MDYHYSAVRGKPKGAILVTISTSDRLDNISLALRLILDNLTAGRPFASTLLDSDSPAFSSILPTTWKALVRRGFLEEIEFTQYYLIPAGWIEALKVTGTFKTPEMQEKAGKLSEALYKRVKGRQAGNFADRTELAAETGLPESFIYDAIESRLLFHLFGRIDATWAPDDHMKNIIDIPIDFNHDF